MGKSMAFRATANIVIAVHTASDPTEEDWSAYCQYCLRLPKDVNRYLIHSEGGGPSAKQRARTNETLERRGQPQSIVAVVTSSTATRGIVTALSWFNPKIRAFSPPELNQAMIYLGLTPAECGQVSLELQRLRLELKR